MADAALILQLDALLPQTQCRQCGYAACRPYAEAMAAGTAATNQCPPAGDEGAHALSSVLGAPYAPLDPRFGATMPPAVAVIDEAACIGCTLCINACPVDAIVGAAKFMHTVATAACTGCGLCLPPCPVDCIAMVAVAQPDSAERRAAAQRAKQRYEAREFRQAKDRAIAEKNAALKTAVARKRNTVQHAIERARARIAQNRR